MAIQALVPWFMGLGGAALPWLMRNPKVAKAIGGKLGKKVFSPAAEAGGKPGGFIGRHPIWSSAGLGYAGTTAGGLMRGGEEEQRGSTPGGIPLPVPGTAQAPQEAWSASGLPSYGERTQSRRDTYMKHMSTIIKHSMLLQFQNPGRKNGYDNDAIQLIRQAALMNNEVEVANMIDEVFKDKKVPKSARTIYNRMLAAGSSPKEAARVSGYTLEMEKTEAKAASDFARSQPKLTDIYSKDALMMKTVQDAYAADPEKAIQTLSLWLKTKVIEMPEQYTQYKPKTDSDYYNLAAAILSGQGTTGVPEPTGEIGDIRVR